MGSNHWYNDLTPSWQIITARVYLALSILFALASSWLKCKKGKWLLASVGIVYIAYVAVTIIWISIRTAGYGLSLQGYSLLWHEDKAGIDVEGYTSLRFGYYLACTTGFAYIALALVRNKFIK
jgi:hypothetical protein